MKEVKVYDLIEE